MAPPLDLTTLNNRLKRDGCRVRVIQRPGTTTLCLRATLPPKPWITDRTAPYRQVIALGLSADTIGLKKAESEARILHHRLVYNEFDWELYNAEKLPENRPCDEIIQAFKEAISYDQMSQVTQHSWDFFFKKFPKTDPLSHDVLKAIIESSTKDSAARKIKCDRIDRLCKFAGFDFTTAPYRGKPRLGKRESYVPTDEKIVEIYHTIPKNSWKWFFGVLATYGLRDHEAFFCEFNQDGDLSILRSKTGPRINWMPLYPEWVQLFNLRDIQRPTLDLDDYKSLSIKAGNQFRRYGLGITPYALRHAYAFRTMAFDIPLTTAAALMGHSPDTHLKRYHAKIHQKHHRQATQRVLENPNRPMPPT